MNFLIIGLHPVILFCLMLTPQAQETAASTLRGNETDTGTTNVTRTDPKSGALSPATGPEYVIGADDILVVNVWKEPDLSRSLSVRPDGKITLPLIGDIVADGVTPKELQVRIENALTEYLSKPAVTVIVGEARSHKFNIIGEIQKSGIYVITAPMTVLDAIVLAGGLRDWAKLKSIYILRPKPDGTKERIAFNYKKVIRGTEQDIEVKTRDTIVVP